MSVIDLQSIAETHENPFIIIDRDSRIVAANRAFLEAYQTTLPKVLGRRCYQVTHGEERPCHELGEECPLQRVLETGESYTCLHIHAHHDDGAHIHHVRVKGSPLYLDEGRFYLGESMVELTVREEECELGHCMMGESKVFLATLEAMKQAAQSDAPVLIQGETGTGKELAANFVHQSSARSKGPFLTLDCTVLTETLVESELFGHERGAFTGSVGDRQGLFKLADGGTLFLDEIGEMPKQLQTKLLRVLETGEFRRVGGNRTIKSDVRIICATNRDLNEEVQTGNFREDLYYRAACLSVRLPSLRERREDIPGLIDFFLKRIRRPGQQCLSITPAAVAELQEYDFPGNVRELKNILQAAATHVEAAPIDASLIAKIMSRRAPPPLPRAAAPKIPPAGPKTARRSGLSLREIERAHIGELLERYQGNRADVAKALGVTERTVYRKLKRYGLH